MSRKCLTCKVEVEEFNTHVKDVWHTYNLRRETVGLNPVSLEVFKLKQKELIVIAEPNKEYKCCSKSYKCTSTYENHLKSKKHLERSPVKDKESEEDSSFSDIEDAEEGDLETEDEEDLETDDEEEVEARIEEPLTITCCLFCSNKSSSIKININHMYEKHQFSLPYPDFIKNMDGLMEYLISLIDEYHVCIMCDKQFYDRLSVRNHMIDCNHIQLNVHLENNADVLTEFYDVIPQPMSNLDSDLAEVELPNGKMIGNRLCFKYFKQNLNGLSNTNNLAITSGMDKAKMSLMHMGRSGKLMSKPGLLTAQEKKQKSKEARYRQFRLSRYSNFQAHFRHQILQ